MFTPTPYGWISQYFIGFFFAYGVYLPFWSLWFGFSDRHRCLGWDRLCDALCSEFGADAAFTPC